MYKTSNHTKPKLDLFYNINILNLFIKKFWRLLLFVVDRIIDDTLCFLAFVGKRWWKFFSVEFPVKETVFVAKLNTKSYLTKRFLLSQTNTFNQLKNTKLTIQFASVEQSKTNKLFWKNDTRQLVTDINTTKTFLMQNSHDR